MPNAGYEAISFFYDNQVHICGGAGPECYRYDAAADKWTLFTSIPQYVGRWSIYLILSDDLRLITLLNKVKMRRFLCNISQETEP